MRAVSVDHYENFPVASVLCPPRLRPAVAAIYWFARRADDLADEGDASALQRLADLAQYRRELDACLAAAPATGRWPQVFGPLTDAIRVFSLPAPLLHDLLSAFEQDVVKHDYTDRAELLDYCRRSANPIGRLLLHLHGIGDDTSLVRSDAICTALQLANFWQDLSIDTARGRLYVPQADRARHGVAASALFERRAGWELRLVVQGGLRILEKIERMGFASLRRRPALGWLDAPLLLWRALCMRPVPTPMASKAT